MADYNEEVTDALDNADSSEGLLNAVGDIAEGLDLADTHIIGWNFSITDILFMWDALEHSNLRSDSQIRASCDNRARQTGMYWNFTK